MCFLFLIKKSSIIFPNAQIIAATHSPSVLQNATSQEFIPLYKDEILRNYELLKQMLHPQ